MSCLHISQGLHLPLPALPLSCPGASLSVHTCLPMTQQQSPKASAVPPSSNLHISSSAEVNFFVSVCSA